MSESPEIPYRLASGLTASDRRRAIYERAASKFRALGTPIDTDPAFISLVDQWIEGSVKMAEVARSYAEMRDRLRLACISVVKTRGNAGRGPLIPQEQITDLENVIGSLEPKSSP